MKKLSTIGSMLLALAMTSCEVIGDIFSAGMYTGIFLVVFVVVVIIFIIRKISRR